MLHKFLSMRSVLALVLLTILTSGELSAQDLGPGEWRTYTSMRSVADVALSEDSQYVWAATSGGAFRVKLLDRTDILQIRNSNGLSSNEITSVAVDAEGNVFFGGRSGSLDIWSRSSGNIRQERSIMNAQEFGQKSINDIFIHGDRAFLATGYGMTVYNKRTRAFGETVVAFGSLQPQEAVNSVLVHRDTIYAVLSNAVAYTPTSTFNLNNPAAWTVIVSNTALNSVISHLDQVFVSSDSGLKRVDASVVQLTSVSVVGNTPLTELAQQGNVLHVLDARGLAQLGSITDLASVTWRGIPRDRADINTINSLAVGRGGLLIAGTTLSGLLLGVQGGDSVEGVFPSGPTSNSVNDLDFAGSKSALFTIHGFLGASVFNVEADEWIEYPTQDPRLPPVTYRRVFYDSIRNATWFGTHGAGMVKVQNLEQGNPTVQQYDMDEGLPTSVRDGSNYVVGGNAMINNRGDLVVPTWAYNGQGFSELQDNNTFTTSNLGGGYTTYALIAQDLAGTYWIGTEANTSPAPFGVFFLTSSGQAGSLYGGPGGVLGSASVNALIVDQDNALWVGTTAGVQIVADIYKATSSDPRFTAIRKVPFVDEQYVRAIAVDGVGNKWVGTDNGIFVVSADGTDSVARFTKENSPLIDNVVTSISIDQRRGEAYIGTTSGISRVSTIFKQGESDYAGILVYPNPVVQTLEEQPRVFISGLVGASQVNIYTSSGRLVAKIDGKELGGIVTWDGRDENGDLLPSGVYLVSATSIDATDRGQAKFVLIRKD